MEDKVEREKPNAVVIKAMHPADILFNCGTLYIACYKDLFLIMRSLLVFFDSFVLSKSLFCVSKALHVFV